MDAGCNDSPLNCVSATDRHTPHIISCCSDVCVCVLLAKSSLSPSALKVYCYMNPLCLRVEKKTPHTHTHKNNRTNLQLRFAANNM